MLWQGGRESNNVEDRRGSGGGLAIGGGVGTLVIAFIIYLLGGNPNAVLNNAPDQQQTQQSAVPADDQTTKFARTVLAETEDIWGQLFQKMNRTYTDPILVLFDGSTQSGCGGASQATGPFYCPADKKVYLDLSFFNELSDRFGASGEFADAYVIAHEVGHHVQDLLGITDKVDAQRGQVSEQEMNALSVRLELQADFLAGVWAHYEAQQHSASDQNKTVIEPGDIEAALNAANAIGDDRLQKETQGYVVPDAFTHGTSAQRMKWFKKGYDTGDITQGDTFSTTDL